MRQPLISVIVPVYKVEKYLDRCVQSIVDQTYSNLEIILVDDGSPDRCPEICDAWVSKDSRLKVIHTENGGGARARNIGLEEASGEYIAFVDSDDFIFPQMYETLLKTILEYQCDIAECGYTEVTSDELPAAKDSEEYVQLFGTVDALRENIHDRICRQLVWNKLYKAETIGSIRFVEGKFIDDEFFTYRVLGNAEKIAVIGDQLYCYRQQVGSAMHQAYSLKRLDALEAKLLRMRYLQEFYPRLTSEAKCNFWFSCMYAMQMILKYCVPAIRQEGAALINTMLHAVPIQLECADSKNRKQRLWLIMAKLSFSVTCRIRNLFEIGF